YSSENIWCGYDISNDFNLSNSLVAGRSLPIFISHKKKKVVALNLQDSYSDSVVLSLKLFEHDKQGAAIVNPYTAISPVNLMHEDKSRMGNVKLRGIEVEGGSQTLDVLREMVDEHDYIIVGRRHGIDSHQTYGLQDWSEFPELGPVGDNLASSDLNCKTSILVVQQQICL
ncbi:hypothetical protein RYX36_013977, partial [Vicia faba]